ncbi:phosphoglycerate kinase [Streptomyces sp. NPDC001274]
MKTIDELIAEGVTGKRVFVRADLNVPLSGTTITDDGRIRAVAPTVKKLVAAGARVVVASHLGRPKGAPDPAFSLAPAAARLGELIGTDVAFATDTVGESARATVAALGDGQVAVLENLRFNPGETSKDDAERGAFADRLAELADLYVGDGFGAVHRKHASVFDLPARLPHAAGDLIATEVGVLKKLTENVERPYAVVLGGSKVSDKLGVIDHLLERADRILIGGGMAYTFLKAQGHEVGSSLLQEDQIPAVLEYLKRAEDRGVEFVLPVDVVVSEQFPDLKAKAPTEHRTVPADAMPAGFIGLDNGPETNKLYASTPKRWLDSYGWRRLSDHELRACAAYYRTLGGHMGIKDLPQTYQDFERTLDAYEAEHFGWDDGARRVSDATLDLMGSWYPRPLAPVARKAALALLDDSLLRAFRYPRPGPAARNLTRGALRLRARVMRLLPPRTHPHYARQNPEVKGYPDGYEVAELGTFPRPGVGGCPVRHQHRPGAPAE